jgi:drug/metabolite transporter (DMT)-like permease
MESGVAFGLTAALCWGVADFCAREATRAAGTFATLLWVEVIATGALLLVGLPLGLMRLGGLPTGAVMAALALNLVILGGAALLYRAFAIGTLAIVSPIAASFAALTALLALTLSGEHPQPAQLLGIVLTLGGVALASSVPGHPETTPKRVVCVGPLRLAPGLLEALIAMLVFGVAYWALRFVVGTLGGVTVAFIGKLGDLAVLALLALIIGVAARSKRLGVPRLALGLPSARFFVFVVPTALLDTCANIAYNLGITGALISVVSVLSSLFSAVTVLLAWIFVRERLTRWQWSGVVAILLGIALVSA